MIGFLPLVISGGKFWPPLAIVISARVAAATLMHDRMDDRVNLRSIDPSTARAIVEGSASYAASFGLPPHNDYRTGKILWGEIPVGEVPDDIEFGLNGKPLYIAGPYDDQAKQTFIMNCLAATNEVDQVDGLAPVGIEAESSPQIE